MATTKYFLYSREQHQFQKQLVEKMGKKYALGKVIVGGVNKSFTELSNKSTSRYADAKIVTSGDPTTMKYTLPSNS